ncbi:MAG: hypothetical protein ACPLZD_07530 [Candidatus Saccharicenans sp.]
MRRVLSEKNLEENKKAKDKIEAEMPRKIVGQLLNRKLDGIKKVLTFFIFFYSFLFTPLIFSQASDNATLSLTVTVAARYKIEVSNSVISFTRSSWSGQTQAIPANEGPFSLSIKMTSNYGSKVNVWLVANSDLKDLTTGYTIPIGSISWTAQGLGFYSGQLSKISPALVAGLSGSGIFNGTLSFAFADDPMNFAPGSYQATVTILVAGI